MELRFSPLFSGSSGNSIYAGCDGGHLLIDAGVSCARVVAELRRIGIEPGQLSGLLVTHEHIDHIRGVGVLSRRFDLPIYATEGTWVAMEEKLGGVATKNVRVIEPMQDFFLGGMSVMAFDIPHDAAQPVGYSLSLGAARLCVATDIGCVRDSWLNVVSGADAVVRGRDAGDGQAVHRDQRGDPAADVAECAERLRTRDTARENVAGNKAVEIFFAAPSLHGGARQVKQRASVLDFHMRDDKADGPPDACDERDVADFSVRDAVGTFLVRHNGRKAAQTEVQAALRVKRKRAGFQHGPAPHRVKKAGITHITERGTHPFGRKAHGSSSSLFGLYTICAAGCEYLLFYFLCAIL